jgi:hypothetical protein
VIDAGINNFLITIPRAAYDQEPVRRFGRDVVPLSGRDLISFVFRVSECLVS